jgi:hypothetical protein
MTGAECALEIGRALVHRGCHSILNQMTRSQNLASLRARVGRIIMDWLVRR